MYSLRRGSARLWSSVSSSSGRSVLTQAGLSESRRRLSSCSVWRQSRLGETIFALSTAPGPAAIAVVRAAGPHCRQIYNRLCPNKAVPEPRKAVVRTLYAPAPSEPEQRILDPSAIVIYIPGPNSYTGEDMLELHIHGGVASTRAVLSAISQCNSRLPPPSASSSSHTPQPASHNRPIRPARPGEFTQLAFHAGRLSLPQIESLSGLLSAETEQARAAAARGAGPALAAEYDRWAGLLVRGIAEAEALIDFSEDHGLGPTAPFIAGVRAQAARLRAAVAAARENGRRGELARAGVRVALLGRPNVGKSSLLNRLARREAAIVSAEPGTTRDVVEVALDVAGWLVRLGDTAGLRGGGGARRTAGDAVGAVEREGIRRAEREARGADVVLVLLDASADGAAAGLDDELAPLVSELKEAGKRILFVLNKADLALAGGDDMQQQLDRIVDRHHRHLSAVLGDVGRDSVVPTACLAEEAEEASGAPGVHGLVSALTRTFQALAAAVEPEGADSAGFEMPPRTFWQESLATTERQRLLLEQCEDRLAQFLACTTTPDTAGSGGEADEIDVVIAVEYLREAADCLAQITGRGGGTEVEEVLGVIFEKFCVGK